MKIRITKSLLSIYGAMVPGKVVTVPDHIAKNWIKNGIALSLEAPENIPAGMFWCDKHQALHKLDSSPGQRCFKRIEKEKEKVAKAEGKARQKAEVEAKKAAEEEEARVAAEAEKAEAKAKAGEGNPSESAE